MLIANGYVMIVFNNQQQQPTTKVETKNDDDENTMMIGKTSAADELFILLILIQLKYKLWKKDYGHDEIQLVAQGILLAAYEAQEKHSRLW